VTRLYQPIIKPILGDNRLKKVKPALILFILLSLFITTFFSLGYAAAALEFTYGGLKTDKAYSIVQSLDGGFLLFGSTESFGEGCEDVWVLKTNSQGIEEWNKTFGGALNDGAVSVIQTIDYCYAIAAYKDTLVNGDDAWFFKIDASGNLLWNKTYGGRGLDYLNALIQTNDGGFALAGFTESFGQSLHSAWFVKVDSAGNLQWNKTYGGDRFDDVNSLVQTNDGGYALTGRTISFSTGMSDFWVIKTNALGKMQWNKTYGWFENEEAKSIIQTPDGGFLLAGFKSSSSSNKNILIIKIDSIGNLQWNKTFSEEMKGDALSIIKTDNEGYLIAGSIKSPQTCNALLIKIDFQGNVEWKKNGWELNLGMDNFGLEVSSIIQTSTKGYAITGFAQSSILGLDHFWLALTDEIDVGKSNDIPSPSLNSFNQHSISYYYCKDLLATELASLFHEPKQNLLVMSQFLVNFTKEPIKNPSVTVKIDYISSPSDLVLQEERSYPLLYDNCYYVANLTLDFSSVPEQADWLETFATTKLLTDPQYCLNYLGKDIEKQENIVSAISSRIYIKARICSILGKYPNGTDFEFIFSKPIGLVTAYNKIKEYSEENQYLFLYSYDSIKLSVLANTRQANNQLYEKDFSLLSDAIFDNKEVHLMLLDKPSKQYTINIQNQTSCYGFVVGRNIGDKKEMLSVSNGTIQQSYGQAFQISADLDKPLIINENQTSQLPFLLVYCSACILLILFLTLVVKMKLNRNNQ
jgi:hypothetical protein